MSITKAIKFHLILAVTSLMILGGLLFATSAQAESSSAPVTLHKTVKVDGLDIFYREAGDKTNPTILLLHGFPTSSQMYRRDRDWFPGRRNRS